MGRKVRVSCEAVIYSDGSLCLVEEEEERERERKVTQSGESKRKCKDGICFTKKWWRHFRKPLQGCYASQFCLRVIAGAFLGERVVDYGVYKLWEANNVGKRYEDIPMLGQRQSEY